MNISMSSSSISEDKLKSQRQKYNNEDNIFTEEALVSNNPIEQFKAWFEEAVATSKIYEANAMCLATADRNGKPSARYVLLKGYGVEGFEFFTDYTSRKGRDLQENPQAAMTFYWAPLNRSIRIEGRVVKMTEAESSSYFQSRPRNSQISASVSQQSSVVTSREVLQERVNKFAEEHEGRDIARPDCWGGFRLIPDSIEFWQGQTSRLHDRIKFRKLQGDEVIDNTITHMGDNGWVYERLCP